jgi:hypothetical protein
MNERELSQALLQYGALEPATVPAPDPRVLTQKILERDKRNVETYAILTLAFGLLAMGATAYLGYELFQRFNEMSPLIEHFNLKRQTIGEAGEVLVAACGALAFLLLAILCTVMLVFAARRATLRQVNANLMEISQQLKQLQQSLMSQASRPAGSSGPLAN